MWRQLYCANTRNVRLYYSIRIGSTQPFRFVLFIIALTSDKLEYILKFSLANAKRFYSWHENPRSPKELIYIYIYIYFNKHLKPHYIHPDGTIYSSGMWATQRDKIFLQLRYLNFEFNCLQYKREALHSRTWFYYTLLDH